MSKTQKSSATTMKIKSLNTKTKPVAPLKNSKKETKIKDEKLNKKVTKTTPKVKETIKKSSIKVSSIKDSKDKKNTIKVKKIKEQLETPIAKKKKLPSIILKKAQKKALVKKNEEQKFGVKSHSSKKNQPKKATPPVKTAKKIEPKKVTPPVKTAKKIEPKKVTPPVKTAKKIETNRTQIKKAEPNKPIKKVAIKNDKGDVKKVVSKKTKKIILEDQKGPAFVKLKTNVRYSDADLEEFRILIENNKKEVIEELQILHDRIEDFNNIDFSESSTYSMHMAEQGSEAMEKEKTYSLLQRQDELLQKLNSALERIKDKTFGICRVCGCLIAKERLLAVPTTTLSASYKLNGKCPDDGIDAIVKKF